MAFVAKITLWIALICLFFGQLSKFSFEGALIIATFFNIIALLVDKKLKIHNIWFLYFIIYAWLNLIFYLLINSSNIISVLHLIRLSCLLSFFIFPPQITPFTRKLIFTVLMATVVFGLLQYLIWPDFTYFDTFEWDPHLNRIVGTFFDPTFTALVFLLLLIYLFLKGNILIIPTYIAIALTYSRATWLSLAIISGLASLHKKNISIFIFTLFLLATTIYFLPKPYGEGTKIDRTSSILAKIENYKIAFNTIKISPIFGHGYNRLSLIRTDQPLYSHAISGFDNSLLTIWATTGLIGLLLFVTGIYFQLTHQSWQRNIYWISVLIHSFFANSLLYPPILFLLALL